MGCFWCSKRPHQNQLDISQLKTLLATGGEYVFLTAGSGIGHIEPTLGEHKVESSMRCCCG